MNIKTYSGQITKLAQDEVFVFGANLDGFHGAGAAGYASFGVHGNKWRQFDYASKPDGWKGKWNIKGRTGPMVGTDGKSYGLPTVKRAGLKRSLRIDFKPLYECCNRNPSWKFYYAQEAGVSLNGWTGAEIVEMMKEAGEIPDNLYLSKSLAALFT